MKNFWVSFCYLFPVITLVLLTPVSIAQLSPRENRILFQVQKLLEYPQVLQGWTNWTNFCYLPPSPSLKIVCSDAHITEITIIGDKGSPSHSPKPASNSSKTLSERFSIDSLFTDLTKLSSLKVLSLVSLGLWGPLPAKINRLWSLEALNISSNFIYGQIPSSISSLKTLRNLVLADNLFNGSVPDLKSLASLEELNLGNNKLGPEFPSLSNNLVSIVLRSNSLRFLIPSELSHFNRLQEFDISSNKISGNIPSFLFSLPSMQYLNLSANLLSGNLSVRKTCSAALTSVDISNNLLVGKLPSCIGSKSSNGTLVYFGNCLSDGKLSHQHPSSYCNREKALAVKPPDRSQNQKKHSSITLGLILGITGGCAGFAALLALLVLFILKKSKAERANNNNFKGYIANKFSSRTSPGPNIDPRRVPQTLRIGALGIPAHRVFTAEEIEDATNNFDPSNLIREGSQGQLYEGWLRDGSMVLVSSVKAKQKNLPQSLVQHLEVLPKLRHRHLVSVLGHCVVTYLGHPHPTSTVFIVFEHICNGSLRDHLADWRKKERLKWPQRMAISIGVARGIQFLHTGVVPGIFGNDLKIEKILLDDSLNARISEYNIPLPSKSTPIEQNGLNRDMSNEEAEKEDIYQLGVILVEIISGKQITSANVLDELKHELERGLSETQSTLRGATDPSIRGSFAYESLRTAAQITISCLSKVPSKRPSMEDILWHLQYSMQVQEAWTSSGNLSGNFSGNLSGNLGTKY
ncbi:hypothetical protein L6164_020757 [Bauhinia variegata]|uniref:Uncharacterized protein n=1 Tax=Bauhinia variegata TaxID=167791 RepID=A0ACB9N133_BAUVA|nr:hypothetical protein L6164_020757 [Bauhinia variegata]